MHFIKKLFPQSLKNLYHLAQAVLANVLYGFPSRKLKVIGVTGTDGKTTTVQMIAKIFEEAGKKIAVASTINFRINGKEEKKVSHFTTESSFAVQKFARKAVSEGCEYLVLETSSHSLDQHRVWGINYTTAVITNVTREHLDYHKTMEKYRKAKRKLFEMVSKNHGNIVVNLDMEKPEEYLVYAKGKTYGYTCHSERSEESRCLSLVISMPINTSRREGFRLPAVGCRLAAEHRHSERSEESVVDGKSRFLVVPPGNDNARELSDSAPWVVPRCLSRFRPGRPHRAAS